MYEKQKRIAGSALLGLGEYIAVGFGSAMLMRDNKPVWVETPDYEYLECLTVKQADTMAAMYPECDWQIHLIGPLSEFYYQYQGKGEWVLYKSGKGFA